MENGNREREMSANDLLMLSRTVRDIYPMSILSNLTRNEYHMMEYETFTTKKARMEGSYDELIDVGVSTLPGEDQQKKFRDAFSRQALLDAFDRGETLVRLSHRQTGDDGVIHWIDTEAHLSRSEAGDVMAVALSKPVDVIMRGRRVLDSLADRYAVVFAVNPKTHAYRLYRADESMRERAEACCAVEKDFFRLMRNCYVARRVCDEDRETMTAFFDEAYFLQQLETRDVFFQSHRINRDGGLRYHLAYVARLGERDEEPLEVVVAMLDNDSEMRVREDNQRYQSYITALSGEYELIVHADPDRECNIPVRQDERSRALTGPHPESMSFAEIREMAPSRIHPEDVSAFLRTSDPAFIKSMKPGEEHVIIYRVLRGDKYRFTKVKMVRLSDEDGGALLGMSDVDDTVHEQMAQFEKANRDQLVLRILSDYYTSTHYVDLDADTHTTYSKHIIAPEDFEINPSWDDTTERFVRKFVHPKDQDKLLACTLTDGLRDRIRGRKSFTEQFRSYDRNGRLRYYTMRCLAAEQGDEPKKVIVSYEDCTETMQEQMERQVELDVARRKAESASNAKSTFLFNMSHDVRTPMNAILGFAEMARTHMDDPERVKDCLDKVLMSGKNLLSILNDVLDMSRLEANAVTIEESRQNLYTATSDILTLAGVEAGEKNVTLTPSFSNIRHPNVYSDALRVTRVFLNILSNAVRYSKRDSEVQIGIEELDYNREGYAKFRFSITDHGIGMSAAFLAHVFDSFTRERSTTISGVQGTGLGLSIAKSLIELMGGNIEIRSELTVGTTVIVTLPFRIAEAAEAGHDLGRSDLGISLTGKRVLLVEDNELNRDIARDILTEFGMQVTEADDGIAAVRHCMEAIQLGNEEYFDFILMDIQMPVMDGYKATMEIRNLMDPLNVHIPIIALTANAFEEDRRRALEAGMDAHLAKPINIPDLLRTLQSFLV